MNLLEEFKTCEKIWILDVEANIEVYIECDNDFQELVKNFINYISHEVRAEKFQFGIETGDYTKNWKIEDYNVSIRIIKA